MRSGARLELGGLGTHRVGVEALSPSTLSSTTLPSPNERHPLVVSHVAVYHGDGGSGREPPRAVVERLTQNLYRPVNAE